jgi:DNA-binding CsgD family transcriptional regulator
MGAVIDSVARVAEEIGTIEEYKIWVRTEVRRIFPHEMLASGLGHINAGGIGLDYVVTVDFPMRHIEQLRNKAGAIDSPALRRWITTRDPVLFEAEHPWPDAPPQWVEIVRSNGLVNIASHGVYDEETCLASYNSFHRVPGRLCERHAEVLRQLAPLMHRVAWRVVERTRDADCARLASLSEREAEIAQWVRLGKSNGEIARFTKVSENTVKHHLTSIFGKLGVETRAQLACWLMEHESATKPGFVTKIV